MKELQQKARKNEQEGCYPIYILKKLYGQSVDIFWLLKAKDDLRLDPDIKEGRLYSIKNLRRIVRCYNEEYRNKPTFIEELPIRKITQSRLERLAKAS